MKKIITISVLLAAISCTKENITNFSSSTDSKLNSIVQKDVFYIGESYGGGIIFYIDSTGQHGLIAATQDITRIKWYNGTYVITNATGTEIGTGFRNTRKIITSQGRPGGYAALECFKFETEGYSDWYLPSKDELNELYKQKTIVGGFVNNDYWSSTEYSQNEAWFQDFWNGFQNHLSKGIYHYYVRPIRHF